MRIGDFEKIVESMEKEKSLFENAEMIVEGMGSNWRKIKNLLEQLHVF